MGFEGDSRETTIPFYNIKRGKRNGQRGVMHRQPVASPRLGVAIFVQGGSWRASVRAPVVSSLELYEP